MALPEKRRSSISYAAFMELGEDVQYEVINGQVYNMSPSPSVKHQSIAAELLTEFNLFLRDQDYRIIAEIDVCLEGEKDVTEVSEWVKPDIVIVCDKDKIKENRIAGAPDLIVEILSKSTAKIDRMVKFNRYQRAGVDAYWIVDPAHETIEVYTLKGRHYILSGTYASDEVIQVNKFDGLTVDLRHVFREDF